MATEGDDQEPIPITKREKEDKDLTKGHSDTTVDQFPPGELKIIDSGPNQPLETVTYMVKKENAEPASYLGENVSTVFEGNVGASEGDKFLESPLVAKVADTEPSRVPEDYLADEKPNQAEKETVDNKTQLQKEQKIEFKEEKRDGTEKSETNHDMISTVMVKREETLEKEKIFDQSDEITNVKLSIEEKPPSTDEASSCSQEEQTDGTNTDINTAFECRKQVLERQEASPGQNEEAPVLTTDLRVDSLNMHNGIVPEAPNKEESIDNTCSTNPTSIQDEFAETSSGGEKYKESDESSMSNVKSHSGIQNDEEATMEVGNDAEGQLDSPYIPKIIEEVRLQKAGLEVEGRLEETSTDKFKSIEKMEDIIPVKDENKEKSLDTPLVKEDVSFQNAYKEETFKDGSVIGSEEIVESPKEVEIQNEVLERTTQADSTTSEMVKVVKDLEQKLDDSFIKHKACLQRDGAELTLTEASNEDNRDGEGFTVTEAEDNNSNTEPIIAEGHGKQGISKHGEGPAQSEQDELEIEKFERSLNVNSEEIETAASSEYDEKIAHVREQEPAENNEESFKGIEKAEKPTNADDFIKNATPIKKDLPHIDMNNKIQNAEVEVPKRYSNDLQLLLTEETEQGQGEEKNEVSKSESKKQVDDTTTSSTVEEKQIDDPPEVCKIAETISEHMSTRSVKTMELISNKSKVEMEKLVQLYELDTKKKLEVEDAREVQNKDDAADMEGDKITAKREEDGPVKIRSTVSIEEETIEQSLEETAPELRSGDHSHKAEKNNNIDDEVHDKPSTTGIDKAFQGQIIKYSNVTGLQPEAIEETVKSIQHDEKEAQKSGGEDTEDHTEQLSPEPIGEDLPKTHHDDKKELEKSKGEIFEASNTPEASENIAWEKYQNDRDENGSCTIVNDNKDDNTRQVKTAENTSEENEDSAEILHKNETTKNLEDKVNVMPEESKATDSNATAETIICVKGKRTIQNLEEDLDLVTNIESGENEVMSRGEISEFETATAGESIACETNQNDEIQEGNSIEASLEEKDEKESRIIVTKNNDNTVLVKVEKNQEDKISKYKEDSKEILQKNESGEELVHMLDVRPKESEAAASSEDAEEIINVKEEGTTENLEEAVNIAKNFETDKNEEKKSKGEISDETKTETVVESIAREINQNDEIPERVSMEDSMEKHENGPCIIVTEENNDDTTLVKVEKSREDKILKDKEDSKEILQKDESREEPVHKLNATPEESMSADSSENSEEIIHVDKKATIENCEEALDLPKNIEVNEKEVKKSKAEISDETETDTVVESIACETNQNDEMPERISIEASMEEKDGNGPCITLTEENNYSTTPVKVEKNQEDKMLKDEEDSKEILQKDESGEKPAHKLNAISKDSAAADSSENAEGIIHVDERAITENLEEALDLAKNIEVDEEDVKKSKGEIYEETETDTVESIVHETNQNDEVPERISMEASMEEKDENGPSVTEENNNDTSLVNVEKNREDKILKDKEGSKEILQKDESEEGPVHKFNATPEENAAADSSENAEEIIHVEEKATIENLEEALDPANNIEVDEKEVKKSKGETSEESETARVDVNVGCETNQNDEIPERISMDASMEDKDENNTEDKISKDEEDSKEILQKDESRDDLVQMLNMIPKESNAFGSSEDAEETIHAKNKETTGNLEKVLDIVNIKADEKMISEETETATVDESIACETNQTDEIPERKSMEPSMDKKDENGSCITVTEDENEITALVEVEKSKEDKLSKDEEDSKEISQKDESGQELIDKLNAMPKEREAADSSEDKIINVEEKGTTENVQETLDLVKIIEADEKEAKKSKGEVSEWSKTARVDETIVHETDQTDKIPERISVEDKNEIKPCTSASDNNDNTTPVKVEYIKEDSKVVVQDDESGKVHVHMPKENKAVVSSEEAEETIHVKEEGTTENLAEALDLIQNTKAGEKEISEEMETATMDESIACESIQNDEIPERISREASVEEKDENGPCITVTENNNGNTTLVKVEKNGEDKILKHEEDSKEILQNDESGEEPAHKLNVMPKQSQAADSSENAEEIIHVEEKASTENLKEALDLNVEDEEKEVKKPKGEISESESVTVAESIACETNQNDEILERIPMEASMEERDENGPYTTVSEDSDDTALVKVEKNKEDKISIYDEDSKEVLEKYESGEELGHMFNVMPEESKPTNSSEDTEKIIHVKEEGATENLKEALDLVKNTESDKKEVKKPKEEISEKFEMAAVGETIACEKNQNDETPDEISMQDSMEETDENASRIIVTEDNKDNTALVKVEKNKEYKLSKDEEDSKEMLHKDEPGEELIDKLSAMPMEREAADSSEDAEEIMHVKEKGITENLEEGLDLVKNIEAGRKEIKNSKEKVNIMPEETEAADLSEHAEKITSVKGLGIIHNLEETLEKEQEKEEETERTDNTNKNTVAKDEDRKPEAETFEASKSVKSADLDSIKKLEGMNVGEIVGEDIKVVQTEWHKIEIQSGDDAKKSMIEDNPPDKHNMSECIGEAAAELRCQDDEGRNSSTTVAAANLNGEQGCRRDNEAMNWKNHIINKEVNENPIAGTSEEIEENIIKKEHVVTDNSLESTENETCQSPQKNEKEEEKHSIEMSKELEITSVIGKQISEEENYTGAEIIDKSSKEEVAAKMPKQEVPKIVQTVDKGEDIVKQIMEENDTAKDDFEASVQEHKEEKKPVEEKEDKGFDKEVFETTSACKDTKEQIVKEIDNKDNSIEFSEKETVRESSQENEVEDSKLEFIKMTEATGFAEEIKTETLKDSTELIKYLNASNTTAEETRPKCGNEDFFENSSLVFEGSQEKIKVELLKKEEAISDDSETADVAATTEETSHVEPEDKRQIESSGPHDEEDLAETSGTTIDGETVEETSSFSECKDEETSTTERDDERKESSTLTSKEHGPLITEVSETIEMTLPAENGEAEQTTEATTLSKEDMLTNLDDVSISRSTRKKRASEEFQKYGEKEKHSLEPHTRNNSNESKSTESPKRQKTSELANPNEINKSEDSKYEGILKLEFEEDKFEDKKPSEVSSVSIEAITTSPDTDKATQEEENSSKSFEGGLNEGVGVGKAADELEAGSHSHGCKASVMEEVKNHKSLHPDAKLQHTSELMAEEKHVETHDKSNNIEDSNGAEGLNVAPVEEQTIGQTVRQGGKETYEAPEAKQETIKNVISTEEVLHKVEKADESENIKRQIIQEERSDSKELHMVTIEYKTVNEVKDSDLVSFENLKATEYSAETEAATSEPAEDSNRVRETSLVTDAPEEKQTQKGSNNQSFNDSTLALEISEASMKEEVIEETSNFHEKIDTTSIKEITEEASLQEYQLDEKTAKAFGIISEEKTLKTIETTKTSPQGEEIDGIKLKATSDLANSDQESIAVENPDVDTEKTKRTFDAVLESRDLNAKNIDRAEKIMTMEKSSMENFEEEIKEVNETLLKSQHQGVETRTEDEITTATIEHALPAEKSEDQLQKASSALLTKEQKHRSITKEEDAEDDTKENETRENENLEDSMSTKTIEEILLPKEEPGELKPSTEASDVIEDIKNNPNEEQMKEEKTFDGTSRPEPHESESISGAKFAELIPSESENIPGQSLVITQSSVEEILSEVGEKLDETPSLRQEKTGKNSDYVSHVESPEVLTKFEEKKFEEENSKTATAESRAEENWLEEATDTKDVIENKLSNEEIAEEKVVAKDSHPVLGEETAKKSHQGDELTTEEHQGGKTSGTFKIANNGIQIKEVNSNMLFIVHDPSTTVTNDKEIVSTSNGEKPNTNPNTPTTDAAAKEAPHEKGVDKIKEPSEPAPEKLVHEAVKTYEENIKIDTIVTDKSEILVEDKNHKHVSPLSPSDRTGATGSSDLKGQAIQSHESGTSLTESSQKKISDKESKITEDEKQHEWDSDKQITTEVSAAAEVKDAKDKDELSTGENKRRHDEAENPSAIHTNEYGGTEDQKEKSSTLSQIQDSSIGIVQERGTVDTVIVNEITRDIKQIDKITNAESGNSIPMEANPNEMATMSHTEVQPLAQNIGVEELEQRNASQIEPELKEVEFREQKRMYDTNEEIAESASVDLAGISLSELLQESKNESQQAAGHIVEDRKPTDTKEEMQTKDAETYQVEEAQTDDEEEGNDGQKVDPGSEAPIIVEASRDKDVKVAHKKSHNLLSGVGSKVKHSIAKVKKVITGKSSHTKTASTKSN
ncbi:uncharacterized protein LOC131168145 isoform X3 [Malania oleifera]|uniref:uncharacterized protein LOC131168145 isoform X3 n=1 Tax=Malania oleifera TaxID=397392 RepID=UPI0025AE0F83|nr:uncharacterized protein LOC131168145 isoform X3 [Malania oleifera]